jgi:GDPmannose 4,6-dehydratase
VRELCELAFGELGLDYREYVREDERFYRPAEVDLLVGDSSKARRVLGWEPQYAFTELIREMVREDLKAAERAAGLARSEAAGAEGAGS